MTTKNKAKATKVASTKTVTKAKPQVISKVAKPEGLGSYQGHVFDKVSLLKKSQRVWPD